MSIILNGVGDPVQLEDLTVDAFKDGRTQKVKPKLPCVIVCDPRDGYSVGNAQRACANWGIPQLWWTGDRVTVGKVDVADILANPKVKALQTKEDRKGNRLPREERMKGWAKVELINHQRPFDFYTRMSPRPRIICVEVLSQPQDLMDFEHPEEAVYVFGPEDGSVPDYARHLCSDRIMAPSDGCMNLATAIGVTLAFRFNNLRNRGLIERKQPWEYMSEHRGPM